MAKVRRLKLDWDPRANNLPTEALDCRVEGHRWLKEAKSPKHTLDLASKGLEEISEYCPVCNGTKFKIINVRDNTIEEQGRTYGENYMVEPGSGRLPRYEARVARFARLYPDFV